VAPRGNNHARKGIGGLVTPVHLFEAQRIAVIKLGGAGGRRSAIVRDMIDFAAAHAEQFAQWRQGRGGTK
jgi:hypothetical protein